MTVNSVSGTALTNAVVPAKENHAAVDTPPAVPETRDSPSTARYSSPTLALDAMTGSTIIEYRSTTSGQEVSQIPSRAALEYEQAQQLAVTQKSDGGKVEESSQTPE
jgi:hypothetical protein